MSARTTGRIVIPSNAGDKLKLADKVFQKHLADGATSKLLALNDHDWNVTGPTIAIAQQQHETAEQLTKKAEELYKARDLALAEITGALKASAKLLKGAFSKNPKRLGDYGFVVDDSKQTPKGKK
jgi:hypothetical protein